ncbi:MAG: hypothetical protein AMJ53_04945 [Gammaproteobacteria bacterium SG8_11]|nr:MAG: hypothetical protein AMJ53_04945 [Gammaproteobacteria bacterium SG8_11]
MKQKHIVLVDGSWVGHHPTYIKTFIKILLGAGYQVTVLCPAPGEVSLWVERNVSLEQCRFKAHDFSDHDPWFWRYIPNKIRKALLSLARWFHVSQSLKKLVSSTEKPDLVFFAWLDSYLSGLSPALLIDWLFPYFWSGLYFHPTHYRDVKNNGIVRKKLFSLTSRLIAKSKWTTSVAVLDEGVLSKLHSSLPGKQVILFPDFADEIPCDDHCRLAREIGERANGRKVIGLLGGLSKRKGLLTLIRTVEQSGERNWYFVFAGVFLEKTFSKEELTEINIFFNTPRDNCYFHLEKIPNDAQFNAVLNACSVIFAMYEDFPHSSNLVTKSAAYGKKVLVSSGGYMEEVVRRYNLGEVVHTRDIQSTIGALHRLTARNSSHENMSGMEEYAKAQSQKKLEKVLLSLVETSIDRATSIAAQ